MSKKIDKTTNPKPKSAEDRIEYHPNGQVKSKIPLVNGKRHGLETVWRENGTKKEETPWDGGKRHGIYTEWDKNGHKDWQTTWRNGNQHGLETVWNKNGAKWYEITWNAGARQGVESWWWENGKKKGEVYCFNNTEYASIDWNQKGDVTVAKFLYPKPSHNNMKKTDKSKKSYYPPLTQLAP